MRASCGTSIAPYTSSAVTSDIRASPKAGGAAVDGAVVDGTAAGSASVEAAGAVEAPGAAGAAGVRTELPARWSCCCAAAAAAAAASSHSWVRDSRGGSPSSCSGVRGAFEDGREGLGMERGEGVDTVAKLEGVAI
jgi:Tfp pilus assembly protein PilV